MGSRGIGSPLEEFFTQVCRLPAPSSLSGWTNNLEYLAHIEVQKIKRLWAASILDTPYILAQGQLELLSGNHYCGSKLYVIHRIQVDFCGQWD